MRWKFWLACIHSLWEQSTLQCCLIHKPEFITSCALEYEHRLSDLLVSSFLQKKDCSMSGHCRIHRSRLNRMKTTKSVSFSNTWDNSIHIDSVDDSLNIYRKQLQKYKKFDSESRIVAFESKTVQVDKRGVKKVKSFLMQCKQ